LENFVQQQIDTQTYHPDANFAVLKFYQFHPEKLQKFIVAKILIKTLMNLPSTDFMLSLCMIPEKLHSEEPIKILIVLSQLLESAQFSEFWVEANTCKELLEAIHGFYESIRGFIIGVVGMTYQTLTKEFLAKVLNMKDTDLDAFIIARGWKHTATTVTFPRPEDSSTKSKKAIQTNIKLQDLPKILATLS